jgi:hypothetical protein
MDYIKTLKGYEGRYCVERGGKIFSHTSKDYLKPWLNDSGYYKVNLFKDRSAKFVFVHRIIAQTFIENPESKPEINHINGVKIDNRVENLEWVTRLENAQHCATILKKYRTGSTNPNSTLSDNDVVQIRNLIKDGEYQYKIAEMFNVSKTTINKIHRGVIWKHVA